jgi:imidazolonepropionase-like amidohydrolase
MNDVPFGHLAIPAALKAGGKMPLLPVGEIRVEKVASMTVTANGESRAIEGYAVYGLSFLPWYEWFNADGTWFGEFSPWGSTAPRGWDVVKDTIVAKQVELQREYDKTLFSKTAHKAPAAGVAFTHARVLDVVAGKWLANQTVIVVGDEIKAVGAKVAVPKGAEVIDLGGKALLPGMIDMHSHLGRTDAVLDIAFGVTTARDVGNDPDQLDAWKRDYDEGVTIGPRVVRMGFIEGRNEKAASSKVTAETPDEAKAAVEEFAKRGYEGIKIYNSMKPELVPILTKLAHDKGMLVTGHIPVHMLANEAVKAGYDGIEHINMLFLNFLATHDTDTRTPLRFTLVGDKATTVDLKSKQVSEFIALLKERKTVIDPTLVAFQDLFLGESGKVVPGFEPYVARLPAQIQRSFLINGLPNADADLYKKSWKQLLAMVKALHDAKIQIVVGTDHIGGLAYDRELQLLVEAGIPTADVLRMATIGAARSMKLDAKIGTIAVGKVADLVIVDGDPLADITTIGNVTHTMSRGVLFESASLCEAVGVSSGRARH